MSTQTDTETIHGDPELVRMTTLSPTNTNSMSTASTEWGPGTIMGRILLGFGEAVKDGIDNIIIRRRLGTLNSLFPHDETLLSKNLGQIYDDVLELSRPGLYRDQVRRQALSVLLAQIAVRQTQPLLMSLVKWPVVEIQLFVSQVFACMPGEWSQEGGGSHPMFGHLADVYIPSQKWKEIHPVLPLFDFLVRLCQKSQAGGQAVLDAGLPDLLVSMTVRDFSIPSLGLEKDEADGCRSVMLDVCHSLLMHMSAHADIFRVLVNHPLCALWPKHHLFHKDLAMSANTRWRKRRLVWRQVEVSLVDDRLKTIPVFCELPPRDDWEVADFADVCVDLLEFLGRSDVYGDRLSSLAQSQLLECIVLGGRRCEVLANVLCNSSYEENTDAFLPIICYLLSLRQALPPLCDSTTRCLSESGVTSRFLGLCILASKRSDAVRRALIDSGMADLLLSVIGDLIPDRALLPLEYGEGDSIPLLLMNRITLVGLVQSEYSVDNTGDNWRKYLCQAVNVLLSIQDVVIHQESQQTSNI